MEAEVLVRGAQAHQEEDFQVPVRVAQAHQDFQDPARWAKARQGHRNRRLSTQTLGGHHQVAAAVEATTIQADSSLQAMVTTGRSK